MKKATLVDPVLLAFVEQHSPDIYAYYKSSPFSAFTFVDYSTDYIPMLMQTEAYEYLVSFAAKNDFTMEEIMEQLRFAYLMGSNDLFEKYYSLTNHPNKEIQQQYILMSIALNNYPLKDFERYNKLLNADLITDKLTVSFKTVYMDALYYESWKMILRQHYAYNELFIKINLLRLKNINPENMSFSLS